MRINIVSNTIYFTNIRVENGAGLLSNVATSNGQRVIAPLSVFGNSESNGFSVFPNPIKNHIYIQFDAAKFAVNEIRLFDAKGILVLSEQINYGNIGVQTHSILLKQKLAAVVYNLQLLSKEKSETINIVKGE